MLAGGIVRNGDLFIGDARDAHLVVRIIEIAQLHARVRGDLAAVQAAVAIAVEL